MKNQDDTSMASIVYYGLSGINKLAGRRQKDLKTYCTSIVAELEKKDLDGTGYL